MKSKVILYSIGENTIKDFDLVVYDVECLCNWYISILLNGR